MNVRMILLVLVLAGVAGVLSGCSSLHNRKGDPSALRSAFGNEYDVAYMQRINAQARNRGDIVIWVNPPQADKRVAERD
ncbi:MAG: hypothetical protein JSS45_11615 [Proteobacteria bacterium]|nr:hypothetical protein [Pseudomonadota bacterium]